MRGAVGPGWVFVPRQERVPQTVPRQDVAPATGQHRRHARHRREQTTHCAAGPLSRGTSGCPAGLLRSGEVTQVPVLVVVELQRPSECVEHLRTGVDELSLLHAGVVGGADPGQPGQLLAPQPRHAPPVPVIVEPHVLRPDAGPALREEVAEPGTLHAHSVLRAGVRCLTLPRVVTARSGSDRLRTSTGP